MTCSLGNSTPTSVYRYYDDSGVLVYVGITSQGIGRNRQHNADKVWWPFVASQQVDHFSTRDEAHAREVELIHTFRQPFNVQHNREHRLLSVAYVAMRAAIKDRPSANGAIPAMLLSQDGRDCSWQVDLADASGVGVLRFHPEKVSPITYQTRAIGIITGIGKDGHKAIVNGRVKTGWRLAPGEHLLYPKVWSGLRLIKRLEVVAASTPVASDGIV